MQARRQARSQAGRLTVGEQKGRSLVFLMLKTQGCRVSERPTARGPYIMQEELSSQKIHLSVHLYACLAAAAAAAAAAACLRDW